MFGHIRFKRRADILMPSLTINLSIVKTDVPLTLGLSPEGSCCTDLEQNSPLKSAERSRRRDCLHNMKIQLLCRHNQPST